MYVCMYVYICILIYTPNLLYVFLYCIPRALAPHRRAEVRSRRRHPLHRPQDSKGLPVLLADPVGMFLSGRGSSTAACVLLVDG